MTSLLWGTGPRDGGEATAWWARQPCRPRSAAPTRVPATACHHHHDVKTSRGATPCAPCSARTGLHVAEGYGSGPRARGAHHTNEPSSTSSKIPTKRASHVYVVVFKKSADADR